MAHKSSVRRGTLHSMLDSGNRVTLICWNDNLVKTGSCLGTKLITHINVLALGNPYQPCMGLCHTTWYLGGNPPQLNGNWAGGTRKISSVALTGESHPYFGRSIRPG